jgi:hypothetical protein
VRLTITRNGNSHAQGALRARTHTNADSKPSAISSRATESNNCRCRRFCNSLARRTWIADRPPPGSPDGGAAGASTGELCRDVTACVGAARSGKPGAGGGDEPSEAAGGNAVAA